jgi:hypothetical protein
MKYLYGKKNIIKYKNKIKKWKYNLWNNKFNL